MNQKNMTKKIIFRQIQNPITCGFPHFLSPVFAATLTFPSRKVIGRPPHGAVPRPQLNTAVLYLREVGTKETKELLPPPLLG